MPTTPATPASQERSRGNSLHGHMPWCGHCHTDDHLVVEAIAPLTPPQRDLVDVEYACGRCDRFYAHVATVCQVAAILETDASVPEVLRFGHEYIHCGEAMQEAVAACGGGAASRTLRCSCGFLLAVPSHRREAPPAVITLQAIDGDAMP